MSLPVYKRILEQAGTYLYRIQFYDNGEPFINKAIPNIIPNSTVRVAIEYTATSAGGTRAGSPPRR